MKRVVAAVLWVALLGLSGKVQAAPILWSVSGHWYDVVASGSDGSWTNAENTAVANGGHLVTINDAAEEAWLTSTFGTTYFWIGFTDEATEGTWIWSSGEPVTYTNWSGGEPNNYMPPPVGEDYAVMNWATGWNDWSHQRPDYTMTWGIAEYTSNPAVPEPGTIFLLGSGLVGLAGLRRRSRA